MYVNLFGPNRGWTKKSAPKHNNIKIILLFFPEIINEMTYQSEVTSVHAATL